MVTKLGIASLVAGFMAWLLGTISRFMGLDNLFVSMTLSTLSEDAADKVVNAFSSQALQDILYTLFFEIHLGFIFLGFGVLLLIVSMFVKDY